MTSRAVAERATEREPDLTFKIATEEWELEQVFELNYATFVEEVPQHDRNSSRRLVDRFHDENTYFICPEGEGPGGDGGSSRPPALLAR